jgi:hypothetical protein
VHHERLVLGGQRGAEALLGVVQLLHGGGTGVDQRETVPACIAAERASSGSTSWSNSVKSTTAG